MFNAIEMVLKEFWFKEGSSELQERSTQHLIIINIIMQGHMYIKWSAW